MVSNPKKLISLCTLCLCGSILFFCSTLASRLYAQDDESAWISRLQSTSLLYQMDTDQDKAIFQQGQALGNQANVFTKVGDSNTHSGDFLRPIGMNDGQYCQYGADYAPLQDTVQYFSVPPGDGALNSFDDSSAAAVEAFTSAAALDPFFAQSDVCQAGENSVACQYRRVKPSVSIIMLGGRDAMFFDVDSYRANMEQIVQYSIDQGVIPVLTTFVVRPDQPTYQKSLQFNNALLDMVEAHGTPLINLWVAAQSLPDDGIGPDESHLSDQVGQFCAFNGQEKVLGVTLRNLLTLQALDALRQNVLAAPASASTQAAP